MRYPFITTTAAAVAVLGVSVAPAEAAAAKCSIPKNAITVLDREAGKVWKAKATKDAKVRDWYGCVKGRKPMLLERGGKIFFNVPVVRGRFIAYGKSRRIGSQETRSTVVVRDLRARRRVASIPAVSIQPTTPETPVPRQSVTKIVLSADGEAGWIGLNSVGIGDDSSAIYEVRAQQGTSSSRRLDAGPDIASTILSLSSSGVLRWSNGGTAKSAQLNP